MFNFKIDFPIPEDIKCFGLDRFVTQGIINRDNIAYLAKDPFTVYRIEEGSELRASDLSCLRNKDANVCLMGDMKEIPRILDFLNIKYTTSESLFTYDSMDNPIVMHIVSYLLGKSEYKYNDAMFLLERRKSPDGWTNAQGEQLYQWWHITDREEEALISGDRIYSPDPNMFLFELDNREIARKMRMLEDAIFEKICDLTPERTPEVSSTLGKFLIHLNYLPLSVIKRVLLDFKESIVV